MNSLLYCVAGTYRNRIPMSLVTLTLIIIGIYTMQYHQTLVVDSLAKFIELVKSDNNEMAITFSLNSLCGLGMLVSGLFWLGQIFKSSYYDDSEAISKLCCAITGILVMCFAYTFIAYLLAKLSWLLIVGGVGFLYLYNKK